MLVPHGLLYHFYFTLRFIDRVVMAPLFGTFLTDLGRGLLEKLLGLPDVGPEVNVPLWGELLQFRQFTTYYFRPFLDRGWGLFVNPSGSQYISIRVIANIQDLCKWSFWLDVCAFSSSIVLLLCIFFERRTIEWSLKSYEASYYGNFLWSLLRLWFLFRNTVFYVVFICLMWWLELLGTTVILITLLVT